MNQRAPAYESFMSQAIIDERELEAYREAVNPGHYVKSVIHYHVAVDLLLLGKALVGDTLPWSKTHGQFRFREGEVTLWHGINGHGKSAVTTQVAAWLAINDRPGCLASFEMPPEKTLERMVKQCAGNPSPSLDFSMEFFLSMAPVMSIYDKRGRADPGLLFAAMRYCADKRKCKHFFVDSLQKCVRGSDDYNGQKDFVQGLCDVAVETKMHIHLIHHTKKLSDESQLPGKFDARGAGEITDQVDNVLGFWRNKRKEAERAKALYEGTPFADDSPDFMLICDKQRHGSWEGKIPLWGDVGSWHFRGDARETWERGYKLPFRQLVQSEPGAAG